MPISYAERKKRHQAALQELFPGLSEHLALRHVDEVAKLSPESQQTLAKALSAGLRRITSATTYLRQYPQASAEDVLRAGMDGRPTEPVSLASTADLPSGPEHPDTDTLVELTNLLQDCFPGMLP